MGPSQPSVGAVHLHSLSSAVTGQLAGAGGSLASGLGHALQCTYQPSVSAVQITGPLCLRLHSGLSVPAPAAQTLIWVFQCPGRCYPSLSDWFGFGHLRSLPHQTPTHWLGRHHPPPHSTGLRPRSRS